MSTTQIVLEIALAAGRFEPCDEFVTESGDDVCSTCGWLDHEHSTRVVLRRAS
jgi:hypothetical protein